ncbi:MAG: trigger factor [Peptoniphilaceae bacterium]|nr:trigger factor [Peptoniphilaceae bacterium]MDY6018225.1 trigger factor [Anaerococcus sp.]
MTDLKSHENNIAKFDLTVPAEDFAKAVDQVYKKNKSKYRVDGFRKGKVPKKIIESMYGPEVFYDEAIQIVFFDPYEKAIKELELETIDQPSVDFDEIVKGQDVVFKVEVETKPHPVLGDYSELEVKEVSSEVTEDDIMHELKHQQEENARIVPVEDRPAQEGDTVNIDFDGYLDGQRFEGGKAEGYDLVLGSHSFVEGFEDQVVGHNISDKFDVNVTFPADYQATEFQGKAARFEVEINKITKKELPELDDEFAKDISEFDSLDELKANMKDKLKEDKEKFAKRQIENEALQALIEKSEITSPEVLVNREIDNQLQDLDQRLQQMGMGLSQYIEMTGMKLEDIRSQYKDIAEDKVKANLALDEVALKEGLEVSEDEVEQEIKDAAEQYGVEDFDKFKEIFEKNIPADSVIENVKRRKALELLASRAKFVEKKEDQEEK